MLGEMTSIQISEWLAYDRVCPPDVLKAASMICATVANFSGHSRRAMSPADFLPARRPAEQDDEEMKSVMMAMRPAPKGGE